MNKEMERMYDEYLITANKYLRELKQAKSIDFGTEYFDKAILWTSNVIKQASYHIIDKYGKSYHNHMILAIRKAISKIDFSNANNDEILLKWLIKHGVLRGNTRRVALYLEHILYNASRERSSLYFYLMSMIMIHRHKYTAQMYDDFFELYYSEPNKYVPYLPFSAIEENYDWAIGNRDCYRLKMELINSPKEVIEEVF